jgi:hypothetical protein
VCIHRVGGCFSPLQESFHVPLFNHVKFVVGFQFLTDLKCIRLNTVEVIVLMTNGIVFQSTTVSPEDKDGFGIILIILIGLLLTFVFIRVARLAILSITGVDQANAEPLSTTRAVVVTETNKSSRKLLRVQSQSLTTLEGEASPRHTAQVEMNTTRIT